MLPDGWVKILLNEVAVITSGGTPSRSNPNFWNGTIPWVTTGEIHQKYITDTCEKITELGLKSSSAKIFPESTILIAMYGQGKTRGSVARLAIKAATNQACAALMPRENCEPIFLFYNLDARYEEIRGLSNDGSQKNLNAGLIKNLPILLPPLPEQQKIAEILETWDAAIETVEALIANSQAQKKALMQQLLTGKRRLPGFSGEWEVKELGKIGTFSKGKGLAKDELQNEGKLPAIPYTAIYTDFDELVEIDNIRTFTSAERKNLMVIDKPYLLIASSSNMLENIGKATAFFGKQEIAIGGDVLLFQPKINVGLLSFILNTPYHRNKIVCLSQGSTIRHVYGSTFNKYEILLPTSPEEQAAITNLFIECRIGLKNLFTYKEQLIKEKAALMQQLLTGKRRVAIHTPPTTHKEPTHA